MDKEIRDQIEEAIKAIDNSETKSGIVEISGEEKLITKSENGDYYYYGEILDEKQVVLYQKDGKVALLKRIPKNDFKDSLYNEVKVKTLISTEARKS